MNENQGGVQTVYVKEDIKNFVTDFLNNRRTDAVALAEAVKKGDFNLIREMGHAFKGSGGSFGFNTITEIGKSMVTAADESSLGKAGQSVERLNDYLNNLKVAYQTSDGKEIHFWPKD